MSEHVYPVPADSHHLEELLDPFLKDTVQHRGLTPDEQFLIVLFGEDASEHLDETSNIIDSTGSVARKSRDINQLSVVSIDERRLNTFTTSLLYALLETDEDQPLQTTLRGDYIAEEDERKVDYYLPRLIDNIKSALNEEGQQFEDNLDSLFPINPGVQQARDMNQRLEKDVVSEKPIIDFLLLAAASTEDQNGVQSLLRYIREENIDDGDMLSGGRSNVSGYSRIIEISYLLNKNKFNSEFRTARELYDKGTTSGLISLLNETEEITVGTRANADGTDGGSDTPIEAFYDIEQRVEPLITSQFQGNATAIARRLLRTINGTRLIENNRDLVQDSYQSQKKDLESEIATLRGELSSLKTQGDEFNETTIIIDTSESDPYKKIIDLVDDTDSLILRYVFGFDRTSRTSAFTTLETRLREYREELAGYRARISDLLGDIRAIESRCDQAIDDLDRNYEDLEAASVEVDPPDRSQMVTNLENVWEEEIVQLKHDLPTVDFTEDDESLEETLDEWEKEIDDCRERLNGLITPIDQLEETAKKLKQIDEKRDNVREALSEIDELMVEQ